MASFKLYIRLLQKSDKRYSCDSYGNRQDFLLRHIHAKFGSVFVTCLPIRGSKMYRRSYLPIRFHPAFRVRYKQGNFTEILMLFEYHTWLLSSSLYTASNKKPAGGDLCRRMCICSLNRSRLCALEPLSIYDNSSFIWLIKISNR